MPSTTKFTARRFGSCTARRVSPAASGSSSCSRSRGQPVARATRTPSSVRTQTPDVGVAALVARPRRRRCGRAGPAGSGRRRPALPAAGRQRLERRGSAARRRRPARPSGSTATWSTSACGNVRAVKTPYGAGVAGRRGQRGSPGTTPAPARPPRRENARPDRVLVAVPDGEVQQRAGRLLGVRRPAWSVRASVHASRPVGGAERVARSAPGPAPPWPRCPAR